MTVNVLNDKVACPSLKWFYGLPEDRREKAIKASFMYRLAVDETFQWQKLQPYADHSEHIHIERHSDDVDKTIVEMVDALPDMLLDGYRIIALSGHFVAMKELGKMLGRHSPEETLVILREQQRQHKEIEVYLRDNPKRPTSPKTPDEVIKCHMLNCEFNLRAVWNSLEESCPDGVPSEVVKSWRLASRAKFISLEVNKAISREF